MQEALQKIDNLVTLLEEKNAATEVLNKQLSEKKIALADVERRQIASANQLAAKERIYRRYDDFEIDKKELKESVARNTAIRLENTAEKNRLTKLLKKIEADQKETETMKVLFKKKNANMDTREIEYNTKFKLMRDKVLEEIKGKL